MYDPNFCQKFTPYLDPDTWLDENGYHREWKNRPLVKDAPQSAIDAFNEFKKLEADAEKDNLYV